MGSFKLPVLTDDEAAEHGHDPDLMVATCELCMEPFNLDGLDRGKA